jgi:peroxiredoxin family protein
MARYALRNQQKISSVLGADFLENLLKSADYHFANCSVNAERLLNYSKEYDIIKVKNRGGESTFIFCVIAKKFDVYTLAFLKEEK